MRELRGDWNNALQDVINGNIRHISFDFWRTIAFSNEKFKNERVNIIKKYTAGNASEIQLAFGKVGKDYNVKMESENYISSPFTLYKDVLRQLKISDQYHQVIFDDILAAFLIYPPIVSEHFKSFIQKTTTNKITYSITSNTAFVPGETILKIIKNDEYLSKFIFCLFSDNVKCAKPHPSIYQLVYNNLDTINKGQILHIGDNRNSDYYGAINFGFKSSFVDGIFK